MRRGLLENLGNYLVIERSAEGLAVKDVDNFNMLIKLSFFTIGSHWSSLFLCIWSSMILRNLYSYFKLIHVRTQSFLFSITYSVKITAYSGKREFEVNVCLCSGLSIFNNRQQHC